MIETSMRERGYPPSVREIGEAVGLTSPSTVHSHLASLQRMGYLKRDPTKPRAIEVRFDPSSGVAIERRPVRHVPLVGDVAAGTDVLAQENVEELFPLPEDFTGTGELFMLRVRGDSMIDVGIMDGDFVVARAQTTAVNGEIVIAGIPGEEATVKTFQRKGCNDLVDPRQPSPRADGVRCRSGAGVRARRHRHAPAVSSTLEQRYVPNDQTSPRRRPQGSTNRRPTARVGVAALLAGSCRRCANRRQRRRTCRRWHGVRWHSARWHSDREHRPGRWARRRRGRSKRRRRESAAGWLVRWTDRWLAGHDRRRQRWLRREPGRHRQAWRPDRCACVRTRWPSRQRADRIARIDDRRFGPAATQPEQEQQRSEDEADEHDGTADRGQLSRCPSSGPCRWRLAKSLSSDSTLR